MSSSKIPKKTPSLFSSAPKASDTPEALPNERLFIRLSREINKDSKEKEIDWKTSKHLPSVKAIFDSDKAWFSLSHDEWMDFSRLLLQKGVPYDHKATTGTTKNKSICDMIQEHHDASPSGQLWLLVKSLFEAVQDPKSYEVPANLDAIIEDLQKSPTGLALLKICATDMKNWKNKNGETLEAIASKRNVSVVMGAFKDKLSDFNKADTFPAINTLAKPTKTKAAAPATEVKLPAIKKGR